MVTYCDLKDNEKYFICIKYVHKEKLNILHVCMYENFIKYFKNQIFSKNCRMFF